MILISNLIIPIITLIVIIYGLYKKTNIFQSFTNGVEEGLKMTLNIFPTIFAMIISISVLTKSNIIIDLSKYLEPVFNMIRFPSELLPLSILRPISGTASLMAMNDILSTYGPDSNLGKIASVIQGSTDTTIYIIGLYFGSVGIKKTKYALAVGLLADLFCVIIAINIINIFY